MSYESFYGLKEAPFFNIPDERYFFSYPQNEKAMLKIIHALKRRMGLCLITAGIGTGKTMLSRKILELLRNDFFETSLIVMVHDKVEPAWFLKKMVTQFGGNPDEDDKMKLLNDLYGRLSEISAQGKIPVVMIDEANMIKNKEFFEEIRGLLNFENKTGKMINFVFFGLPELRENLQLDLPLTQRVSISIELKPMDERTTIQYIRHRLSVAGAERMMFDQDALIAIYRYSGGIPRLINTIADNALLEGYIERKKIIDQRIISNTLVDLGLITSAR